MSQNLITFFSRKKRLFCDLNKKVSYSRKQSFEASVLQIYDFCVFYIKLCLDHHFKTHVFLKWSTFDNLAPKLWLEMFGYISKKSRGISAVA